MFDSIDAEQSTDVKIGGPVGSHRENATVVHIDQTVEVESDARIDIDIEDELEARFDISVLVSLMQHVETDQDIDLDIVQESTGHSEVVFDADQIATIDHEVGVRIDFALA
jgi:hypothetical protein